MTYSTLAVQEELAARGFDPGPRDGVRGPKTIAAIRDFQKSHGLQVDGIVGPETSSALFRPALPEETNLWADILSFIAGLIGAEAETEKQPQPPWLKNAYLDLGEAEIKGPKHNLRVLEYWQAIGQPVHDDETPWCAAGIGCWLEEAGLRSTRSGLARSYGRDWGIELDGPALGAVAVKPRGGSTLYGHVTLVAGQTSDGQLACLGANQNDRVQISSYSVSAFSGASDCGFFWPMDYPAPELIGFDSLPLIDAQGKILKEA
ncbi:TIGR02594 family protein [Martelella mediterranea]|uniref:Uncharacterized protein (TIGR02594 family) n=1 Tax=Martelella mediterranea TaxID=293089 RepID=A0A4R3NKV9_9HYPH|nr:TIGR02594 family protein [Martelella mediterranea]TCT34659.1 uncharacterized protein (TIGR02594 family) [Martelella mediterranea]